MKTLTLIACLSWSFGAQAQWLGGMSEDPMTDELSGLVMYAIDNGGRLTGEGMTIRCGNSFSTTLLKVVIDWGEEMWDPENILYRFDKNEPQEHEAVATTGHESRIDQKSEVSFVQQMMKGTRLTLQAPLTHEIRKTIVIPLTGFTAAYNKACGEIKPVAPDVAG